MLASIWRPGGSRESVEALGNLSGEDPRSDCVVYWSPGEVYLDVRVFLRAALSGFHDTGMGPVPILLLKALRWPPLSNYDQVTQQAQAPPPGNTWFCPLLVFFQSFTCCQVPQVLCWVALLCQTFKDDKPVLPHIITKVHAASMCTLFVQQQVSVLHVEQLVQHGSMLPLSSLFCPFSMEKRSRLHVFRSILPTRSGHRNSSSVSSLLDRPKWEQQHWQGPWWQACCGWFDPRLASTHVEAIPFHHPPLSAYAPWSLATSSLPGKLILSLKFFSPLFFI